MCRNVGIGGECASCAEILTIADLLGADLEGGAWPNPQILAGGKSIFHTS